MLAIFYQRRRAIGRLLLATLSVLWLGLAVSPCVVADDLGSTHEKGCMHARAGCCDHSGGHATDTCPVMQVADSQPDTQQPVFGTVLVALPVFHNDWPITPEPPGHGIAWSLPTPKPQDDPAQRFRVLLI